MKQTYFIYNGIRYNAGTILIVTDLRSKNLTNSLATFEFYDTDACEYQISICGRIERYSQERFDKIYKGVWNNSNKSGPVKAIPESIPRHLQDVKKNAEPKDWSLQTELKIHGLKDAWVLYILIMCVGVLFYDRFGIWIFASIAFFKYRKKKLIEAGYK